MSKRAEYIKTHYSLRPLADTLLPKRQGWQAIAYKRDGRTIDDQIVGLDRSEVCREARCRWGHFNFEDEARAFGEIFR